MSVVQLSEAEALLVRIAHNEANEGHDYVERILQSRLATATSRYNLPDGIQLKFVPGKDGGMAFEYEAAPPARTLKLFDENGVAAAQGATVGADEDDGS